MVTLGCLNEWNLAKEQDGNNGQFEKPESSTSVLPESQLFELNKRIKHLESKLKETLEDTKAKEQKVWELELVLSNTNFPKMDGTSAPLSVLQEVNSELEVLLKEKMEAEIEYSILRTTPNWKTVSEDRVALLNELRHLAGDQEQMILKLRDAEHKTIKLSERTDELGAYSKELVGTEYVLRQQHIVYLHHFSLFPNWP